MERRTEPVGGMASLSTDGRTVRVLLYNWVEDPQEDFTTRVRLQVQCPEAFAAGAPEMSVWQVDDQRGNAYDEWLALGSPPQPDGAQHEQLMRAADIPLVRREPLAAGRTQIMELDLPVRAVALVELRAAAESGGPLP